MADQPKYRAGQRVRVTVEGTLYNPGDGFYIIDGPRLTWASGAHLRWAERGTVEILAEPRPDEPKGAGAVVRAGRAGDVWVRLNAGDESSEVWRRTPGGLYRDWADIQDPITVLADGWVE